MQFKVPQDVQRADHIIGPLTLRQLIICGIGFSVSYGFYTLIGRTYIWITALIPTIIIVLITVVFAFIRPLDLAFEKWFLFAIEFHFILPKKRFWIKGTGDPLTSQYMPRNKKKKAKTSSVSENHKPKTIQELNKILNNPNLK